MPKDKAEANLDAAAQPGGEGRSDVLGEVERYLARQVRERPITVLATAVGVGLVLGLLIGGRR